MCWLTVVATNAITQILASSPNSHKEVLVDANAEADGEQAAQTADQDDSK